MSDLVVYLVPNMTRQVTKKEAYPGKPFDILDDACAYDTVQNNLRELTYFQSFY